RGAPQAAREEGGADRGDREDGAAPAPARRERRDQEAREGSCGLPGRREARARGRAEADRPLRGPGRRAAQGQRERDPRDLDPRPWWVGHDGQKWREFWVTVPTVTLPSLIAKPPKALSARRTAWPCSAILAALCCTIQA